MASRNQTPRRRRAQVPIEQRLAYRPREVAALTGRGEGTIYSDIATGALYAVRRSHRLLVPADAVRAYLHGETYRPR